MDESYEDLNEEMYKKYYQFDGKSKLIEKIWSDAFGENYPVGINHFGFLTKRDLEMFSTYLNAEQGDFLLDIGCGKGGPSLKMAEWHKLKLTGIDIIPEAVRQANLFKKSFELTYDAEFKVGGFGNIPLPDASVDHVLSVDAFWMVHNKPEALKEIKRVMKKGARFVFTTWDSVFFDQAPVLENGGFEIISCKETENWKSYQTQVYKDILKYRKEILDEIGEAGEILISEATTVPPMLEQTVRRIYHTRIR